MIATSVCSIRLRSPSVINTRWMLVFLIVSVFSGFKLEAQNPQIGASTAALGYSGTTSTDVFSVFNNPSGLDGVESLSFGLYAENRLLLKDVNLYALAAALPTASGTFGLGIDYFGNSNYNRKFISLAYGRTIFETLSIGANFSFQNLSVAEHGSTSKLTFGLGLQYSFYESLKAGVYINNPLRTQLTDSETDLLPSIIHFGISYAPSDITRVVLELEQELDQTINFKGGVEYGIHRAVDLRIGFSTHPVLLSFGVGIALGNLGIDIASHINPDLGYSPQLSVLYEKKD